MSRINNSENIRIQDNREIYNNCLIIDFVNELESGHNYLNEKTDECLICFSKLTKDMVIVNNRYCKCFYYLVLCDKCFVNWIFSNCNCFICRKTFQPRNKDFLELFNFINRGILLNVRLNSLNKKPYRSRHRANNRFMGQINTEETESIINNVEITEDNLINNINTSQLNEIQIGVPNNIRNRRMININTLGSSSQIINNNMLLRFAFIMLLTSSGMIFFSFLHLISIP